MYLLKSKFFIDTIIPFRGRTKVYFFMCFQSAAIIIAIVTQGRLIKKKLNYLESQQNFEGERDRGGRRAQALPRQEVLEIKKQFYEKKLTLAEKSSLK